MAALTSIINKRIKIEIKYQISNPFFIKRSNNFVTFNPNIIVMCSLIYHVSLNKSIYTNKKKIIKQKKLNKTMNVRSYKNNP
jgi:hypothetical protein